MNRIVTALAAVTLLGAGGSALRAQNTHDTTFAVRGTPRLSVNNPSGRVTVRSWNRPAVRLVAQYDEDETPIAVEVSASRVAIRTDMRGGDNEVDYTISVPTGTAVEVQGISPDVDIASVCGAVSVNVVSGDVRLTCAQGDVGVQSVSGDLTISDVRSGSVDASSTSGDVILRNVQGPVTANSVSGDVSLTGVDGTEVTAETVSGDIGFTGRIADNGRYRFEAHSGEVVVRATNTFNASVSVSTFSGDFNPNFPITITPGRQNTRDWEFTVGSGSARLSLKSFSGTITLVRGAAGREEE